MQYLDIPGPLGRFAGFWATLTSAAYSYSGIESITNAAAETKNPRRNIPKAAKRIFWRILIFYVLAILVVTMIVPSNNENLLSSTGTATQSPFGEHSCCVILKEIGLLMRGQSSLPTSLASRSFRTSSMLSC